MTGWLMTSGLNRNAFFLNAAQALLLFDVFYLCRPEEDGGLLPYWKLDILK